MLLCYKAISNTEINGTGQKKKERGSWKDISDIKDIKREDIESRLGRNYMDIYKIFLSIYPWPNNFKVKYIFSMKHIFIRYINKTLI